MMKYQSLEYNLIDYNNYEIKYNDLDINLKCINNNWSLFTSNISILNNLNKINKQIKLLNLIDITKIFDLIISFDINDLLAYDIDDKNKSFDYKSNIIFFSKLKKNINSTIDTNFKNNFNNILKNLNIKKNLNYSLLKKNALEKLDLLNLKSNNNFDTVNRINIIINEIKRLNEIPEISLSICDDIYNFNLVYESKKLNRDIIININLDILEYPYKPPNLMVIKPILKNNFNYHLRMMNIFKIENWTMTNSLPFIISNIIDLIDLYAIIEEDKSVSDIYKLLFDLSICSKLKLDIKTNEQIQINQEIKKNIELKNETNEENIWKQGTGYGTKSSTEWNIKEYIESNKYKNIKYNNIIEKILNIIENDSNNCLYEIKNSVLIEFLINNLFNNLDIEIIEEYPIYYKNMLKIMKILIQLDKTIFEIYIDLFNKLNINFESSIKLYKNDIMNELNDILKDLINVNIKKDINQDYVSKLESLQFNLDFSFNVSNSTNNRITSKQGNIKLRKDISILQNSLPLNIDSGIFVRVSEDNMQHMKALIIPSKDTPYSNGCFIFDIFIPETYPLNPPKFKLLTTGNGTVRFNPNLYACGKVCLSLLGTWEGNESESWNNMSSILQVLISIQSLIFVEEPFFNEPGYEKSFNSEKGKQISIEENNKYRYNTYLWAILDILKHKPLEFEDVINTHFYYKKNIILEQLDNWAANSTFKYSEREKIKRLIEEINLK